MLISKKDTFFIAGHKGMVGQSVCRVLKKNGFKNILTISRKELDLRDFVAVSNWFKVNNPNIVILSAAKVGGIQANIENPTDFLLDNLKIQNNVIESAWRNNTRRLLFLGSSCIYPKFAKQPINEEQLLNDLLEPTNECYALAKIVGIKLCESLRKQHNFDAISMMPSNLYGPGDNYHPVNSHVLAAFIRKIHEAKINHEKSVTFWGSGKPFREFMHVDDLSDAILFSLKFWDPSSKDAPVDNEGNPLLYLNVGYGEDIQIRDLANMISSEMDYKGKILWDTKKKDGTPRKLLNIYRIKKLGWEPKIPLSEGIKDSIASFKEMYNLRN
tara:strand:+ start:784 stop:1767 length:984 start_codon:yes stop_codon:yes gene_type:complete